METKNTPPSVILTIVVLFLTSVISSQYASITLGRWAAFATEPFPAATLLYAIGLCLIPILAIIDILHAKPSGRYLGLFAFMILLGLILRVLSYQIAMPIFRPDAMFRVTAMFATLTVLLGHISLIYRLGFGTRANEYFDQAHER